MKIKNHCVKILCLMCIFVCITAGCESRSTEKTVTETTGAEETTSAVTTEEEETTSAVSEEPETEASEEKEPVIEEADWSDYFDGLNAAAVIYDAEGQKYTVYNSELADTESSPCSTFKIVSSLIALENGIIEPENSVRTWSGEVFWNEDWNKDIGFEEAFRTSCVWYFRQVIDDIGKELMQEELDRLQYGNCDISDWEGRLNTNNNNRALTGFWIESSLKISPKEQTEVMSRIFGEDSEYSQETVNELKNVMLVPETADSDTVIYGKTGMGKAEGIVVDAWFTGFAENAQGKRYFCVRLGRTDGMNVSSSLAKEIAIRIVSDYGAAADDEEKGQPEQSISELKIIAKGAPVEVCLADDGQYSYEYDEDKYMVTAKMSYILQTHRLTKTIGGRNIVENVNLHVKKGEIYGFLGPNGAGKTTVMKMLTNLWKPTDGSIELFGEPLRSDSYDILKRIGSIIEFPAFYEHMTGYQNLKLHCEYMGYYRHGSIEDALEMLQLNEAADKKVKTYSLGMKERLGIARAILCKPELLILDEPTNGLDPAGIKQIRDLLKALSSEFGITVLISSHILSEIESMADTIGIINHSRLIKEIGMDEIEQMNLSYIEVTAADTKKAAVILTDDMGISNFKIADSGAIRIYDGGITVQQLSKTFALKDVEVFSIGKKAETLEDYFLKITSEVNESC